jgi:uncharacterized protein
MLAFNVAQLLKEGTGASRQRELSGELRNIDDNSPEPVRVEGRVHLVVTPEGVLAMGEATMTLRQTCRRCLESTDATVTIEIEEEFYPTIDIETGRQASMEHDDEPELLIDEHHILDLTEVLRQYAIAQTLEPGYCRADCKGLCPVCGVNRNLETCTCETQQVDPRLAILAQLLGTSESQE